MEKKNEKEGNEKFDNSWDKVEVYRNIPLYVEEPDLAMMLVEKDEETLIPHDLGSFFRKYNLIVFKSGESLLNSTDLNKVMAIACLCKINESWPANEVTVTLFGERKPLELLEYLSERGKVTEEYDGIYCADGLQFPVQIAVVREMDKDRYGWLKLITTEVSEQELKDALLYRTKVKDRKELGRVDSVLHLAAALNREAAERVGASEDMREVFEELFGSENMVRED